MTFEFNGLGFEKLQFQSICVGKINLRFEANSFVLEVNVESSVTSQKMLSYHQQTDDVVLKFWHSPFKKWWLIQLANMQICGIGIVQRVLSYYFSNVWKTIPNTFLNEFIFLNNVSTTFVIIKSKNIEIYLSIDLSKSVLRIWAKWLDLWLTNPK